MQVPAAKPLGTLPKSLSSLNVRKMPDDVRIGSVKGVTFAWTRLKSAAMYKQV